MKKNILFSVLVIMLMIASASAAIAGNVEGNKKSNENQDFVNPILKILYTDSQENKKKAVSA